MKDKLLIIGASGHGNVVADIALKMNRWKSISFLDDNIDMIKSRSLNVIGTPDNIFNYINEYEIFIGIGNNNVRQRFHELLESLGASIPVLIHPDSVIGNQVELGLGTVIMPGVVINCNTKIGKSCIVNTASSIDHDNILYDYVHVSPGVHIAGTVNIGRGTWLGIGSIVSNNVKITSECIFGAGSVVVKDINESGVYVGVPVRRIK
ncbi:acetyltransferase [Bacillus sp. BGMRC 2118]|nr:acetyltransferase [Bacillus sp. BGMRC 2118]